MTPQDAPTPHTPRHNRAETHHPHQFSGRAAQQPPTRWFQAQNDRFYAASDARGTPLVAGAERGTGFAHGGGLRGRKVYPHQGSLSEEHKSVAVPARSNASVREWIAERSEFTFDIWLDDLDPVEAGALLWLLTRGEGHHLKLGGGRPLGFGSVTLSCDEVALSDGAGIGAALESLARPRTLDEPACRKLVARYRAAVEMAYGNTFESVSFIHAYLAASTGDVGLPRGTRPTHYPRKTPLADDNEHSYKWFAANEHPQHGGKNSLPPLGRDRGLRRDGR